LRNRYNAIVFTTTSVFDDSKSDLVVLATIIEYLDRYPRTLNDSIETLNWDVDSLVKPIFGGNDYSINITKALAKAVVSYKNMTAQRCFDIRDGDLPLVNYGRFFYVTEHITNQSNAYGHDQSIPLNSTILNTPQFQMYMYSDMTGPNNSTLSVVAEFYSFSPDHVYHDRNGLDLYDDSDSRCKAIVSYCLAEPIEPYCELNFTKEILLAVIVLNVFKIILFSLTVRMCTDEHINTLGDAIQYFLDTPDVMVKGLATAGRKEFAQSNATNLRSRNFQSVQDSPRALRIVSKKSRLHRRWFYGATRTLW